MLTFREFKENFPKNLKDASGKAMHLTKKPIRMASGKIEMHYAGKSGSSGGGD